MTATPTPPRHRTRAGGKRGRLEGAALSQEVLDSSPTVLRPQRGSAVTGLQQFYSPREAAELVARVGGQHIATLDLTAGDGSLLAGLSSGARFGVEIDPDQLERGNYSAIHGDVQHVYPKLRVLGIQVPRIAANPPFGLDWLDGAGRVENSMVATWRMSHELLTDDGCGAFVAGRDRFRRDVMPRADAAGVYAIVECNDLFDGVSLPVVIAFFVKANNKSVDTGVLELRSDRAGLVGLSDAILDARRERCGTVGLGLDVAVSRLFEQWREVNETLKDQRATAARARAKFDVSLNGRSVHLRLSPWARLVLSERRVLRSIERLHKQSVAYFALNTKEWRDLVVLAEEQIVTIDPALSSTVETTIEEATRLACPMYPLKPQQRLAYLDDLDQIRCTKDDPERGFVAGETYPLRTYSRVDVTRDSRATVSRSGEVTVRKYEREAKVLGISIDGGRCELSESAEDVSYLIEHFDVPDPGDIATRYPERVQACTQVVDSLLEGTPYSFKQFQREDLARFLVKGSALVGWEQGLGKSLGGMALIEASIRLGCKRSGLIVAPQDLVSQWQEEARKFFGWELEHITTPQRAREVAEHLRRGGEGIYITHYEVLSLLGRVDRPLEHRSFQHRKGGVSVTLNTEEHCPSCIADRHEGWQRRSSLVCERCRYVHKELVVKPASHHLAHAFRHGVIVIDEGTLFKGDTSLRSKAIRGLRAQHRYVLSGTPISNYVNDVFWLLWWCLGNATVAFPYDYETGRAKFEADFCVIEHIMGRVGSDTEHKRERRKVLPQVTNVSRLWRLLAGGMIRRRKEDTGEPLVPCTVKPVLVPMGVAQQRLYGHWLSKSTFADFFSWKHPGHALIEAGLVERYAAGIGQLTKLEYATTLPEADPDPWPGLEGFVRSNWTPKNMKVLDLALKHAQAGEKVLIGSDLIEMGPWLVERLREHGINAVHITEEGASGRTKTMNPRKRAQAIHEFRHGDAQVLCCGIPSVRLGHNLDTASVVIVDGLVFSYEMLSQFIARAHRLTSTKPVTVYMMIVIGSLDESKWTLFSQKSQTADLALDGQLIPDREDPIPLEQVLRDLQKAGITITGDEIDERDLKQAWIRSLPTRSTRRAQRASQQRRGATHRQGSLFG